MSRLFVTAFLVLITSFTAAEQLTLYPNTDQPGVATAGIPFAPCVLTNVDNIRLSDAEGAAVPVFTKATLMWPIERCGEPSIRALKLQFEFDPAAGVTNYVWSFGSSSATRAEAPVCEVVRTSGKAGMAEPCAFLISPPEYLISAKIIPPSSKAVDSDADASYTPLLWERYLKNLDYATAPGHNWLLDRASMLYTMALRFGNVDYYREAYLAHEYYVSKLSVSGAYIGGWDTDANINDVKFMYAYPLKLHLALSGDDTWSPQENGFSTLTRDGFLLEMAETVRRRSPLILALPYSRLNDQFTERHAGVGLKTLCSIYELTGNSTVLGYIHSAIGRLRDMARNDLDGVGHTGYLSHSYDMHEGSKAGWLGWSSEALTSSDSITIDSSVADDYLLVKPPVTLQIHSRAGNQKIEEWIPVARQAVRNADGTVSLFLSRPITVPEGGAKVWVRAQDSVAPGKDRRLWAMKSDRIYSPWMQAILADAAWHCFHAITSPEHTNMLADLMLGFAHATAKYSVDGKRMDDKVKDAIESAFDVRIHTLGADMLTVGTTSKGELDSPYVRYTSNKYLADENTSQGMLAWYATEGRSADQHIPEIIFQLALGLFFESDPARKEAIELLIGDLENWYKHYELTAGEISYPVRAPLWQLAPNPEGTLRFVREVLEQYGL